MHRIKETSLWNVETYINWKYINKNIYAGDNKYNKVNKYKCSKIFLGFTVYM